MKIVLSVLLWVVVVLSAANAPAVMLTTFETVPDGSARPPGDRVDLQLLFLPGEAEITLELRAYRVEEEPTYKAVPLRSRISATSDAAGNFLLTTRVTKPVQGRGSKVSLVVPYAHLAIGKGMHGLAYEVTGRVDKKIDFVRASKVSVVVVTNKARTEMRVENETVKPAAIREKQTVHVVKDGKVTSSEVEIEIESPTFDFSTEQVKVSIPGEFQRPPKSKRTILYATNRSIANPKVFTAERYGNESAARVTYGAALVNIPVEAHRKGQLEVPGWWSSRDPSKHFLIESLGEFRVEDFRKSVSTGDILLFVHGYNTNFEFEVLRTAQLVHDLEFPGQGVAFSWPSQGSLTGYFHDEKEAAKSSDSLAEVLETLVSAATANSRRKIHVVAHSMGNRVFMNAVRRYQLKYKNAQPFLGQVALAAPDVDGATFAALLPSVQRSSDHVTLYYCRDDRALEASRTLHQDKPVGLGPWFAEGLDTVNADNANTEMLGHGYYASSHPLLIDLRLLLVFREPADRRLPPLSTKTLVLGYPHWAFSAAR